MASKKRPGRPPKRSDELKSDSLLIRLGADEKQGFREAAEHAGVDLSTWARERLRLAAIRELEAAGYMAPFLRKI
jgi:hypothetical protein